MLSKFTAHIEKNFTFLKNKRLLIAVSGGLDSMVLLTFLKQWNADLSVAHCNFGLRGSESDGDEVFVASFCKRKSIPFFSKKFVTQLPKHSVQMAARTLRYEWFESLLDEHSFDFILTAHHADDNLETVLINLTRGAGIAGLSGIPPVNNRIVRPLLPFSKKEILDFAQTNNLEWREDSSNQKLDYVRNQIRHQVVPALKNIQPQLIEQVQKSIHFLSDTQKIQQQYFESLLQKISTQHKSSRCFSVEKIKQLHPLEAH
jgi:tRNA(Ile)-lysidine synthase